MLYYLHHFADDWTFFNLFQYITFRAGGAIFTAMLIIFLFGGKIIKKLRAKQGKGQPIRDDGPEEHFKKRGTPTMGGLMIIGSWLVSTLLWADLSNIFVWAVILVTVLFSIIGFLDDYAKVMQSSTKGVSGKARLVAEFIIAIIAVYILMIFTAESYNQALFFPFLKDFVLNLGLFFIPFGAFVIVASANAVNLTDGLDGLAIVPVIIAAMSLGLIAYLSGRVDFATYLQIPHTPGTGELTVLCTAILGAGLGFLWYNAPPADIFMGDTGSLGLGGMLGTIGVATKHEIVLAIIGGLFVLEAVSVIIQVLYYKRTKKRIFLMAPIHHHFEKKGWSESQVVVRFWIIAVILALIGLASLKLR